jgi:hypothetical protein
MEPQEAEVKFHALVRIIPLTRENVCRNCIEARDAAKRQPPNRYRNFSSRALFRSSGPFGSVTDKVIHEPTPRARN